MNVWAVKAHDVKSNGKPGWHWGKYFAGSSTGKDWGGRGWIESRESKQLIRDEVRKSDLVVCYQVDDKAILGLTRMASDGREETRGSGDFNILDLAPRRQAFELDSPLLIKELRTLGCDPACFRRGRQGTVFRVNDHEFCGIVAAIGSPSLRKWLDQAGWGPPMLAAQHSARRGKL